MSSRRRRLLNKLVFDGLSLLHIIKKRHFQREERKRGIGKLMWETGKGIQQEEKAQAKPQLRLKLFTESE